MLNWIKVTSVEFSYVGIEEYQIEVSCYTGLFSEEVKFRYVYPDKDFFYTDEFFRLFMRRIESFITSKIVGVEIPL